MLELVAAGVMLVVLVLAGAAVVYLLTLHRSRGRADRGLASVESSEPREAVSRAMARNRR